MTAGQVTRDGALVSTRSFARDDYTKCNVIRGDFAPMTICPEGTDLVQTEDDSEETAREKMPLATRSICPPGYYPLASGEEDVGVVDACAPCVSGTHKSSEGDGRCLPCELGYYCDAEASIYPTMCTEGSTRLRQTRASSSIHLSLNTLASHRASAAQKPALQLPSERLQLASTRVRARLALTRMEATIARIAGGRGRLMRLGWPDWTHASSVSTCG